jgi:TP901 family phage tail tape measure protein
MAMTKFGAGIHLTAEDEASPVVQKAEKNFGHFFKSLNIGAAAAAAGVAAAMGGKKILGALQGALQAQNEFSMATAEVATIADATAFPMERINKIADDMSVKFGMDAAGQAKALYQTISAGVTDAAAATETLNAANLLAVGGLTTTEAAVDGITSVMNAYADKGISATEVADSFFVAIKAGKTTAEELSSQIGRVATSSNLMGISMDEMLAALAAVTTKGIDTGQTISGMAGAMSNLNKPTTDATNEAKRLGIEFSAAALRSKGLKGFLDGVTKSAGYNEDSMAKLFGSIEAFKVMAALGANQGAKFAEVLEQMEAKSGAAEAAFKRMAEEMAFAQKRMDMAKESIKRTFGASVQRLMLPVVKLFAGVAEGVRNIMDAIPPQARDALIGVLGALAGLMIAAGGLVVVVAGMRLFGITITGLISAVGGFVAILGPMIIFLGGLAVAGYAAFRAFKANIGGIGDAASGMWSKVKLGFQGVTQILSGGQISKEFADQLQKGGETGVLGFLNWFKAMADKFGRFWEGLKAGFEKGLAALAPAIERLKQHFSGLFALFDSNTTEEDMLAWGEAGESVGEKLASFGEVAIEMIIGLSDMVHALADDLSELTAKDVLDGFRFMIDIFNGIKTAVSTTWEVVKGLGRGFSAIIEIIKTMWAVVSELFGGAKATAQNFDDVVSATMSGNLKLAATHVVAGAIDREKRAQFGETKAATQDIQTALLTRDEQGNRITMESAQARTRIMESIKGGSPNIKEFDPIMMRELAKMTGILDKLQKNGVKAEISTSELREGVARGKNNAEGRSLDDAELAF